MLAPSPTQVMNAAPLDASVVAALAGPLRGTSSQAPLGLPHLPDSEEAIAFVEELAALLVRPAPRLPTDAMDSQVPAQLVRKASSDLTAATALQQGDAKSGSTQPPLPNLVPIDDTFIPQLSTAVRESAEPSSEPQPTPPQPWSHDETAPQTASSPSIAASVAHETIEPDRIERAQRLNHSFPKQDTGTAATPQAPTTEVTSLNESTASSSSNHGGAKPSAELATADAQHQRGQDVQPSALEANVSSMSPQYHEAVHEVSQPSSPTSEFSPLHPTTIAWQHAAVSPLSPQPNAPIASVETWEPTHPALGQVADHLVSVHQSMKADNARLEITLDPPELGRITIEIREADDQLAARLIISEPTTLETIKQSVPSLMDSLADAGLEFHHFELGSEQEQTTGRESDIVAEPEDVGSSEDVAESTEHPRSAIDVLA